MVNYCLISLALTYAKGLTCEADTLGSCGYVYMAVYPTPETKK